MQNQGIGAVSSNGFQKANFMPDLLKQLTSGGGYGSIVVVRSRGGGKFYLLHCETSSVDGIA